MRPLRQENATGLIAWFFPMAFLIGLGFLILPLLRQGLGIIQAMRIIFAAPWIWTGIIIPFVIIYLIMVLFGAKLHELLLRDRQSAQRRNWRKSRITYTLLGLLTLICTAIPLGWSFFNGRPLTWDQMTVLAVLWIAYAILVIYRWFMKPDTDLVSAYENGDDSKYVDERRQTVMAKSAQTALQKVMVVFLVGGTLYDLLVTKMWPVRTVIEIVIIYSIWLVAYRKWDKEL